jgi:hypothetical protein
VEQNPSETITIPTSRSSWSIETVDSLGQAYGYTSLALDSKGYPHISYYDGYGDLKYAKWTGSAWDIETVDSDGYFHYYTSLALDSNDYPHISYYDYTNENLKYAKWTGSVWDIETVDPTRYVGKYTSLALDTSDCPHISYFHDIHGELMYAKWTGRAWDIEIVDSDGYVGEYTSIALDTNDCPHISYYDYINESLKYAKWTGSAWDIETVDLDGYTGRYTSIALDTNDYPHISYYGNSILKYAKWTGSVWSIETLDLDARGYTSIALDTNDYPHISYYCSSPTPYDDLKYAKWTGSIWSLQVVDSLGDVGRGSSIALDTNDNPHISYYDNSYDALKYAYYISDIVTPPEIILHAPESPVNDYVGATRTFSITINQTVDVSWQIHGTEVQTNARVTEALYTNTGAVNGTWNVSAIVSNANGTDMQTWIWNVTKAVGNPDLIITEKWLCWPDNCTICYNVTNIGNATAPACHNTTLYVDGVAVAHDPVSVDLAPGESYTGCFNGYVWTYTPPSDNITVCADSSETLDELHETNNCLTNIWMCGDVNCDGKVTMSDVRKVFNRYLDPNYPLDSPWAADVNCDGKVTMSDVRKVFNRYLDPGYELNCCCEVL